MNAGYLVVYGLFPVHHQPMFAPWLLGDSLLTVLAVLTTIQNANAAAISNPEAKLKFPKADNLTLKGDFHVLESPSLSRTYWPLGSPALLPNPNYDVTSTNASRLTTLPITCDGRSYGRNLNLQSCIQVYTAMSSELSPKTFGKRGTGDLWDAPLPFRYLSHDGLCAVDVGIRADTVSDTVAPLDLKEAAQVLIGVCVATPPSEGGIMTGLGVNKALSIRIVRYRPSVYCGPEKSGPPWMTCRHILDVMQADNEKQVFGPREFENTTVVLPWKYTSLLRRCAIRIDATEPGMVSDSSGWYQIWAAANAVDFMCVQLGRKGIALGLGKFRAFSCQVSWLTGFLY